MRGNRRSGVCGVNLLCVDNELAHSELGDTPSASPTTSANAGTVRCVAGRPRSDDLAFVAAAAALWNDDQPDVGYLARVFTQTSLPYRDLGDATIWSRRNGSLTFTVTAGQDFDHDAGKPINFGVPFGVIPRLLLSWISTEAVRTKEPVLHLGDSLGEFMRQLGMASTGGTNGTITRLREQSSRLFRSTIRVSTREHNPETGISRDAGRQALVATDYDLFISNKPGLQEQLYLIPSYVRLSAEFFDEVTTRPVPVSMDALRLLKGSPMRLDLYSWLTYRMSYLRKATTVPWDGLRGQFGANYADTRQGRQRFRVDIEKHLAYVLAVYPAARAEATPTGLVLRPSPTHIGRRVIRALPAGRQSTTD